MVRTLPWLGCLALSLDSLPGAAASLEGYTLLSPLGGHPTLVDMQGQVVHVWEGATIAGELDCDGTLVGPTDLREHFSLGREFDAIVEEDWQGAVTWRFDGLGPDLDGVVRARIHHDLERAGLPAYFAPGAACAAGDTLLYLAHRDTRAPAVSRKPIVDDEIQEVDRQGHSTGFSWAAREHVDELDLTRAERAGIARFPGHHVLMPRWFCRLVHLRSEWLHLNAVSSLGQNPWYSAGDERFNPDNLLICARHASFVAIVSRATGAVVWQLGPGRPAVPDGADNPGRLVGPHHAHMIPAGLPGAGHLLIYDNGGLAGYGWLGMPRRARPFSRVVEIDPRTGERVWEYRHAFGVRWIPRGPAHRFFSRITGSAQRLPDGHTLIDEGQAGRVFEVDPEGRVVWELDWPTPVYRAIRVPPQWVPGDPAGYEPWPEEPVSCP